MNTAKVLEQIIEYLKLTDTDKSELIFKVNGNKLNLDNIEKKKNSNNIIVNLKVNKK